MHLIYYFAIWFLGMKLSSTRAQLLYTDRSRDDGPCKYPPPVPLISSNFLIFDPLITYYIPVASENFYRYEYNMATNRPPQTEEEVTSLQTKVQFVQLTDILTTLTDVRVFFFNDPGINYLYRALPTFSINPFLNFKATAVHGSSGSGPSGFGGVITFTVIWNDNSPAWNLWTCVGGRQMFHIISGAPSLTQDQLDVNIKILTDMGFNTTNFQYLKFDN